MKKALSLFFKLFITGLLFYFLFSKLGFSAIVERVLDADKSYFAAAVAVFFISMGLSAWQWQILLDKQGVTLPFKRIFSLYMIGHFFNNFLPGAMGGDVIKVYQLKKEMKRGKEGLAATFTDRFAGLFVLSLFALAASLYMHTFTHIKVPVPFLGSHFSLFRLISILFGFFIIALYLFFSRRVGTLLYDTLLKQFNPLGLRDKFKDIHLSLHLYRDESRLYKNIFLLSFSTQFLRILVHFLAAKAVGFDISFIYFLVFVPLIALLASLPVSFGGLGVREWLGQALFGAIGANPALAVATQFLASLVGIVVSLLGGVFFITQKRPQNQVPDDNPQLS